MAMKTYSGVQNWGKTYSKTRHTFEPMNLPVDKNSPENLRKRLGMLYKKYCDLQAVFEEYKRGCCPYCRILLPKTGICECGFDKNKRAMIQQ